MKGGMEISFDHNQTTVYYPGEQDYIEVDEAIAPLLISLWENKIRTCNSCQENEPGIIWIEFFSMKDVERLLTIMVRSLGERINNHPEVNDWFCYRILGHEGERLPGWRYEAYPNLFSLETDQSDEIYPEGIFKSKVELSVSTRFPVEDHNMVLDLANKYLERGSDSFTELSDEQWDYVKQYLPPQPYNAKLRTEDRRIIDGIRYVLRTGCPWSEIPRRYGSYLSVRARLKRWSNEGVLEPILSSIDPDDRYKGRLSSYIASSGLQNLSGRKNAGNKIAAARGEMAPMSISQ
jgi:transposase